MAPSLMSVASSPARPRALLPQVRILCVSAVCLGLMACSAGALVRAPAGSGGSIAIASASPPAGDPGQLLFTGAVTGTSQTSPEACESSGKSFHHFTATAEGDVSGHGYYLSISVYPYRGPGTYDIQPLPQQPLDYISTPNPLLDEAPGGYPGFLNFVPKWAPGNAYVPGSGSRTSTVTVDPGEHAGWLDSEMVGINMTGAQAVRLRVAGHFACGPVPAP